MQAMMMRKLTKGVRPGEDLPYREIGRPYGISKQAVSNRVKQLAARFGLDRPDSLPKNRESARLMNRRNYGQPPSSTRTHL